MRKTNSEIFSNEQSLMLQQLLTRQALAERNDQSSPQEPEGTGSGAPAENKSHDQLPEKWRLIPDAVTLHDWQSNCLDLWLQKKRGTVKVATGGGKTIFALAAAQALQNASVPDLRLVIVVPTIPLMHQWLDELGTANIPAEKIALMGGGETISDDPDLRILICVLNSARDRLPALVKRFGWSSRLLLVVDECHRANASEAKKVFDADPAYTLGLSATPETETGDTSVPTDQAYAQSDVGLGLGPIIFEFSLKDSHAAGLLTPFEVWHVGLVLNPHERAKHSKLSREISDLRKNLQVSHRRSRSSQSFIAWCQTIASREGGGDASRFIGLANDRKRLVYKAEARTQLTLKILSSAMLDIDRRAIVFHESIEDINDLFIRSLEREIPAVLEHSKLTASLRAGNIDAFRTGVARTIISAKSLVEGFNVPSADLGVIAASSGSVRQRIQSLGRLLRKKEMGGGAIVFVLYIKDTEDEAIYQKADWEAVVGAERNRYFEWVKNDESDDTKITLEELTAEFTETGLPPRTYRPPCNEINVSTMEVGAHYPGQTAGMELRVDQAGNLRSDDKALVLASQAVIQKIIQENKYRRAVRTSCGHLICRTGTASSPEDIWIYLGNVDAPEEIEGGVVGKLILKNASGRRVICKKTGRNEVFARGPDKASSKEAGQTQENLLKWIDEQETKLSTNIRDLYWDAHTSFWIEVNGERHSFEDAEAPLEFPQ